MEHPSDGTRFALRTSTGTHFISYNDVTYCEADGRYTHIHLSNSKCITVARLLKDFEDKLPDTTFIRIHKSYLVNINYITGFDCISKNHLIINSLTRLGIARRRKKNLSSLLNNSIVYI